MADSMCSFSPVYEMLCGQSQSTRPSAIPGAAAAHLCACPGRFYNIGSTWRHYEEVNLPDGLIVMADSIWSFSPVHGQGMTVAALEAAALDKLLIQRSSSSSGVIELQGLSNEWQQTALPIVKVSDSSSSSSRKQQTLLIAILMIGLQLMNNLRLFQLCPHIFLAYSRYSLASSVQGPTAADVEPDAMMQELLLWIIATAVMLSADDSLPEVAAGLGLQIDEATATDTPAAAAVAAVCMGSCNWCQPEFKRAVAADLLAGPLTHLLLLLLLAAPVLVQLSSHWRGF